MSSGRSVKGRRGLFLDGALGTRTTTVMMAIDWDPLVF